MNWAPTHWCRHDSHVTLWVFKRETKVKMMINTWNSGQMSPTINLAKSMYMPGHIRYKIVGRLRSRTFSQSVFSFTSSFTLSLYSICHSLSFALPQFSTHWSHTMPYLTLCPPPREEREGQKGSTFWATDTAHSETVIITCKSTFSFSLLFHFFFFCGITEVVLARSLLYYWREWNKQISLLSTCFSDGF